MGLSRRGLLAACCSTVAVGSASCATIGTTAGSPTSSALATPAASQATGPGASASSTRATSNPPSAQASSAASTPAPTATSTQTQTQAQKPTSGTLPDRSEIVARFAGQTPTTWGMEVPGLVLRSSSQQVVLTFDGCGGPYGSKVDTELLDLLITQRFPACLFLNKRWVEANRPTFDKIASLPELFDIGNHGTRHMPLSVNGRSAYKETGTADVGEVYDEVAGNHIYLTSLLGTAPRFFRTGTAHYDEVAIKVVRAMGEVPIGFDINGDAGTTYTAAQVVSETARAKPGSIVIAHMNQPSRDTYEGMSKVLPRLRDKGIGFAKLSQVTIA